MKADLDTSLDFSRKDEPPFVPNHGMNNDETIILPGFKSNEKDSEEKEEKDTDSKENNIKENKASAKPSFWQTVKSHKWWFVFIGIAAVLIVFIMIFALSGKDNSKDKIRVPDVTNLSEGIAKDKLEKAGLEIGEVTRKHSDSIDVGKVIETKPSPGDSVKKGRSVDIIISSGAGMTKVPNVIRENYEIAADKLENLGFDVIRENQYSTEIPEGQVTSQSIAAGVEVKPKQTTITLVVSQGKPPRPKNSLINLKDLKNYSLKSAQDYAKEHGLTLQINQEYSEDVEKGMVISMQPKEGTRVERGSTITIIVSKGPKEEQKVTNITKTFTVEYVAPTKKDEDDNSDDKKLDEKSASEGNHVQIYIKDDDHSLGNIYRDLYIKHDMSFSIPFSLKEGDGQLRVVRDGQTILNEKVTK